MSRFKCHFNESPVLIFLAVLCFTSNAFRGIHSYTLKNSRGFDITTESGDNVEVFDPDNWVPKNAESQQIEITNLSLQTKVRLRYARTRINMYLTNPSTRALQVSLLSNNILKNYRPDPDFHNYLNYVTRFQISFKIKLPPDAFFTVFKLRLDKKREVYEARVESKTKARNLLHFAHVQTNGSVSAGLLESSSNNIDDLKSYDLKYSLGPQKSIQGYLVFERQLERKDRKYCDEMRVYPLETVKIRMLQIAVDAEEFENIDVLECSPESKDYFENCGANMKRKLNKQNTAQFSWMKASITSKYMENRPFGFCYRLEQKNTTSAALMVRSNGNFYLAHLLVPENLPVTRKHFVFVLDISDSMFGSKLESLKWGMNEIVDDISLDDFFSIITFSTGATVWSKFSGDRSRCPWPLKADAEYKNAANTFINKTMTAHGATNIYAGLRLAFDLIYLFSPLTNQKCLNKKNMRTPSKMLDKMPEKLPENVESIIVLLSDGIPTIGEINKTADLLEFFDKLNHENMPTKIQINTIAFGGDADIPFLKKLACQNGGIIKIIEEDSSGKGVELVEFYHEISSKVLTRIENQYYTKDENENIPIEPTDTSVLLPIFLTNGDEILTVENLTDKFIIKRAANHTIDFGNLRLSTEVKGRNGYKTYETPIYYCTYLSKDPIKCLDQVDRYLERLQQYQRLKTLLQKDLWVQEGYLCPTSFQEDETYYTDFINDSDSVETKSTQSDATECVNPYKTKVIQLAKEFGFITPYTSFILTTGVNIDFGLKNRSKHFDTSTEEEEEGDIAAQENTVEIPLNSKLATSANLVMEMGRYETVDLGSSTNNKNETFFTEYIRNASSAILDKISRRKRGLAETHLRVPNLGNFTVPVIMFPTNIGFR